MTMPLAPALLDAVRALLGDKIPETGYNFSMDIVQQDDAGSEYKERINILGMNVIVDWETPAPYGTLA